MRERVSRVMCQFCRGGGVVWAPRMAVQWGNKETFSLAAPTRCPECRGNEWFEVVHRQPESADEPSDSIAEDSSEER